METETKHAEVELRTHSWLPGTLVIEVRPDGVDDLSLLGVTHQQLRGIVQAAYNHYGILAEPSIAVETTREYRAPYPAEVVAHEQEWTTDPTDLLQQRMDRDRCTEETCPQHGAANRAHNRGVRA